MKVTELMAKGQIKSDFWELHHNKVIESGIPENNDK